MKSHDRQGSGETEDEAPATSTLESENAPQQTSNLAKPTVMVTEEHSSRTGSIIEDEVVSDKPA